jgi:hypothetical protein
LDSVNVVELLVGRDWARFLGPVLAWALAGNVAKLARCSPVCSGISRQASLKKYRNSTDCSNGAAFRAAMKIDGGKV